MAGAFCMVMSDCDGTLLRPNARLSKRTIGSVRALVATGVHFALASGRMPSGLVGLVEELAVPVSLVCYSGAYVLDEHGEEVASYTLSPDLARETLALMKELWPGVQPCYFFGKHWYVEDPEAPMVAREAAIVRATPEKACFADLLAQGAAPHKLFCGCADDPGRAFEMERVLTARLPELNVICSSGGKMVEMVPRGVDKACGARALLGHMGIDLEQTLFFGDDANDVPLLQEAGCGVAMANATREVRMSARETTRLTNAEDGVADYLERAFSLPTQCA